MLRAPIAAAFFVLCALSLASTASSPVHAAQHAYSFRAAEVSASGCPYLDSEDGLDADTGALPEGHPPVARDRLPRAGHGLHPALPPGHPPVNGQRASRLPPGHPPVNEAPVVIPRFDQGVIVDL